MARAYLYGMEVKYMAADGQIVLGLNISETTSQISADLSTILNGLR